MLRSSPALPTLARVSFAHASICRSSASAFRLASTSDSHRPPPASLHRSVTVSTGAVGERHPRAPVANADAAPPFSLATVDAGSRAWESWTLGSPIYDQAALHSVKIASHEPANFGDRFARALVSISRWSFDFVTGYRHPTPKRIEAAVKALGKQSIDELTLAEKRAAGLTMKPEEWMTRIIFLESIAGVPGMVAAVVRHLQSLRLIKRDGGYIRELLSEAENERMHLLCWMQLGKTSTLGRAMIFLAQGAMWNAFFFSYLLSPRICHRFVGYLESQAVITYTHAIEAIEAGELPEWNRRAPQQAIDYWRLKDDATILDMTYAVRADESAHRFVNNTLANVFAANKDTLNPFGIEEPPAIVRGTLPEYTNEEAIKHGEQVAERAKRARAEAAAHATPAH